MGSTHARMILQAWVGWVKVVGFVQRVTDRAPGDSRPPDNQKSSHTLQQRDGVLNQTVVKNQCVSMILPQVHLRKPCYDFSFL